MARKPYHDKEHGYDDLGKDVKPEADEGCNAYYTRKQRTKMNEVAPDTDTDYVEKDDSFAESRNYPNQDSGPLNYKKWDRYGR